MSITNSGVNALATHAFYARPGMVALLHALEPAVADLMSGKISRSLCETIKDESGVLGQSALCWLKEADRVHLAVQHGTQDWEPVDLEATIQDVKKRLLANILGTSLAVKHDCPNDNVIHLKQTTCRDETSNVQWLPAIGDRSIFDPTLDCHLDDTTMAMNHFQHDGDMVSFAGP